METPFQKPEKLLESTTKIRFPDCDPYNHLNNARYLDYIINTREDQLLSNYNLDVHEIAQKQGIAWVVAQTQIAYLWPATLMETVTIQTRVIAYDRKMLEVEAIMLNKDKTHIKAIMWTKFVHISLITKRSLEHNEELMALFAQIHYPLKEAISFEERVKELKASR